MLLICVFRSISLPNSEKLVVQIRSNAGPSLFIPLFSLSLTGGIHMSIMGGWSEATEWLTAGRAEGWDKVSQLWNGLKKEGEEVIVLKEIDKLIPFLAFWGNKQVPE